LFLVMQARNVFWELGTEYFAITRIWINFMPQKAKPDLFHKNCRTKTEVCYRNIEFHVTYV
jgi:hypothetical protein